MSLISVEQLAARIDQPELRIIDVRWALGRPDHGRRAYAEAHIPGAIFLDLETDLSDPEGLGAPGRHPLPEPEVFSRRAADLGIGDTSEVVVYDDAGGTVAARLWWMLDDLGHPNVAVLDGGFPAWLAAGLPTTAEVPSFAVASLHLRQRWSRVIDRPTLKGRLGSVVLLDARAPERYRGEVEPVDPVAGHIPTARSAPAAALLGPGGLMIGAEGLRGRFGAIGADLDTADPRGADPHGADPHGADVVASCGSGVTACHLALAMRVAGLPPPLLYAGSFSDWSRSGERVVTGDYPGELEGQESAERSGSVA